jgi:hypothetical protein
VKPAFVFMEPMDELIVQATECMEGECSVDDVTALIQTLKTEQKILTDFLNEMKGSTGYFADCHEDDNNKNGNKPYWMN